MGAAPGLRLYYMPEFPIYYVLGSACGAGPACGAGCALRAASAFRIASAMSGSLWPRADIRNATGLTAEETARGHNEPLIAEAIRNALAARSAQPAPQADPAPQAESST